METGKRRAGPGVYVRVCGGDFVAGAFLYQFAFLMPKARVRIEGKAWYVRSRKQTMDYWGCSERQYKKAMRFLREQGLIETRYTAGFGNTQALRTTAFRLTDNAMEAIESEARYQYRSLEEQKALPVDEESCDSGREVTARRNEERPGRDTADLASRDAVGPTNRDAVGPTSRDAVDPIHIKKRSESERSESERDELSYLRRSRNAKSILQQECSRKGVKAKIDPKEVERVFVEAEHRNACRPEDRVHTPWGPRLFRMANQFTRKIQIAAAEADMEVDPLDVVAKCVDRWPSFREFAFDEYGVKMAEKPVMPSLLAAVQPAIRFYLRQRERAAKFKRKLPTLAEMFRASTSPPADSPICEEGTLVDVDDQGDVIDTPSPPNAAPAPPATPASPAMVEGTNVALTEAPRVRGILIRRPTKKPEPKDGRANENESGAPSSAQKIAEDEIIPKTAVLRQKDFPDYLSYMKALKAQEWGVKVSDVKTFFD
jgi:hypothetical protein